MSLDKGRVVRRCAADESADLEQTYANFREKQWKKWPCKAGFDGLTEHRGPVKLRVRGSIPSWAAGSLYRTGPGQSCIENTSRGTTHYVSHWFDGFAQSHKFDIVADPESRYGSASVTYTSRRQSEDYIEQIRRRGWRSNITFGQRADPCVGIFAKTMSIFEPVTDDTSNNNVAVIPNLLGRSGTGSVFVTTDSSMILEVDPVTLESQKYMSQSKLHPLLTGQLSCAHPQIDPDTGDVFNFNLLVGPNPTYRIFRVSAASGEVDILATVPASSGLPPAYIHSFFLTENYVILCVPVSHYAWNGTKIPLRRNLVDAMEPFDPDKATRWVVVDRRHGKGVVAQFSTPASFFFHTVNAFEENVTRESGEQQVELVMDAVMYDTPDVIFGFYYDVILDRNDATEKHFLTDARYEKTAARLARYRFVVPTEAPLMKDFSAQATSDFAISAPHIGELPTINTAYATRSYCYVYSVLNSGRGVMMDALCKTDLRSHDALIWEPPQGHTPSEPIFVARPRAEAEDDGVLLSVVLDGFKGTSYLLCLDARSLDELGRAEADFAVGVGFHGMHAPASPAS